MAAVHHTSLAEHYRAHGVAFRLALELGCTPKEAEAEIARIAARERDRAASDRLAARLAAPVTHHTDHSERGGRDEPWMMRD